MILWIQRAGCKDEPSHKFKILYQRYNDKPDFIWYIVKTRKKVERVSAERSVKMIKTMNINHILNNRQLSLALDYFQGLILTYTFKTERKRKM